MGSTPIAWTFCSAGPETMGDEAMVFLSCRDKLMGDVHLSGRSYKLIYSRKGAGRMVVLTALLPNNDAVTGQ